MRSGCGSASTPRTGGIVGNLNYVQVVATGPGSTAYGGTAASLPGVVQAENFDEGGAGVAYQDITAGNSGGQYRATDVDIEVTADTGGGYNVGWMNPGEWLDYSVTVAAAGSYRLDLRVAALGAGGRLHVAFGGVDKTGPVTIPDTGSWQAWTTVSVPVTLAAGAQRMRVSIDAATGGIVGNLNYVQVVAAAAPPPPPPSGDIVIYASDVPAAALHGAWSRAADPTSPDQLKLITPDDGVAHTDSALASPLDYFDVRFEAVANTPYTVWVRLKALDDRKFNDAIWLQFAGATVDGAPAYAIDTTAALLVNLATDQSAASLHNWGWANGAYWLSQSPTVVFSGSGSRTLRVQVREDGVQLDQIVLSAVTYRSTPPGSVTDDATTVPKP